MEVSFHGAHLVSSIETTDTTWLSLFAVLLEDSRYRIRSKLLEGLQGIAAASAKKLHGKVP